MINGSRQLFLLALAYISFSSTQIYVDHPTWGTKINVLQPCIGLLELRGTLRESSIFTKQLNFLLEHPLVHGIIVVINSGGGAIPPSFTLYDALKQAQNSKPILAYIPEVCASGAYLTACAAHKIVASSMASIGSIGVIGEYEHMQPEEFKRQGLKGKIKFRRLKRGKFKQLGHSLETFDEEGEKKINEDLDFIYEQFCTLVAQQRNLPLEAVKSQEAAVFPGIIAKEKGLIDHIGTFDDALKLLAAEMRTRGVNLPEAVNLRQSIIRIPYTPVPIHPKEDEDDLAAIAQGTVAFLAQDRILYP